MADTYINNSTIPTAPQAAAVANLVSPIIVPASQFPLGSAYFTATPTANANNDLTYDFAGAPSAFWSVVRSDGGDVLVTLADGITRVPRQISAFNATAHTGLMYLGTLSGTATAFRVYYGSGAAEPAANSTYGKYNVWESAAKLVAHMGDATDATSNQNNGTNNGATLVTGKVGSAYSFDGSSNNIVFGLVPGFLTALNGSGATISTWVKTNYTAQFSVLSGTINDGTKTLFMLNANRDETDTYHAGYTTLSLRDESSVTLLGRISTNIYNNAWHLLTIVAAPAANSILAYVDGQSVAVTKSGSTAPSNFANAQYGIVAGAANSRGTILYFFNGALDELRLYSRALSSAEILAMYNNQNSPATFIASGAATPLAYTAVAPCRLQVTAALSTAAQINLPPGSFGATCTVTNSGGDPATAKQVTVVPSGADTILGLTSLILAGRESYTLAYNVATADWESL